MIANLLCTDVLTNANYSAMYICVTNDNILLCTFMLTDDKSLICTYMLTDDWFAMYRHVYKR